MKLFYSPAYVTSEHGFDTTRKAQWVADTVRGYPNIELVEPSPVAHETLSEVHDPVYVGAIQTGEPKHLADSTDLPWNPGVWTAVTASNGGVIAAALEALRTKSISGSLSSGIHHAGRGGGKGFCTFNGLVMAAMTAIKEGAKRILILDLDAHCGGGTANILAHWRRENQTTDSWIQHVDISVSCYDQYTALRPDTLDIIDDVAFYLPTIGRRLTLLTKNWDLCLYNAGMDPHESCPIDGLSGVTEGVLTAREGIVFSWCAKYKIPVAFVLAGGYIGQHLDQRGLVALHAITIQTALAHQTKY